MKLYLTSTLGGNYIEEGKRVPCVLENSNQLLEHLKQDWKTDSKCLFISSNPENEEINNSFKEIYREAFKLSGFSISEFDICDKRNEDSIADMLHQYDVLILAGGHVPTQNQFFHRIHLKELIKDYKGIVIGISAGTMNSADVVYAQPELEEEAVDPKYQRYLKGLGLTTISVLPHYQELRNMSIGGLRVVEDISIPDSHKSPFYALMDGSYILVKDGITTLYGEAYLYKDGIIEQICTNNESIRLI